MQKRTFIKSLAAVTALSAIVLLTGCDEEKAVAEKPFRVGVTAGPHAAIVTEAANAALHGGLRHRCSAVACFAAGKIRYGFFGY